MKWYAKLAGPVARQYVIEHDPQVGFYLFVFEGPTCVRDHLQDTLEIAMLFAWETYGVPNDAWSNSGPEPKSS